MHEKSLIARHSAAAGAVCVRPTALPPASSAEIAVVSAQIALNSSATSRYQLEHRAEFSGRKENPGMRRATIIPIVLTGVAFLCVAFANSTMAQVRNPRLADAQQPGSVIVFPKFISGFVPVDGVAIPSTEFKVGVVCPKGLTCAEGQTVKIRFHYVCGASESDTSDLFVCRKTDFDALVTVNGKLVFNPEATVPPGNLFAPIPACSRGYLIGWVVDQFDRPIKFDGLIGDAVLRESATAVSAYNAIPIQAD